MDLHHNLTDFDKFHIFSLCYTNVHHDCATHLIRWDSLTAFAFISCHVFMEHGDHKF